MFQPPSNRPVAPSIALTALLFGGLLVGLLSGLTGCQTKSESPPASEEKAQDPLETARTAFEERKWDEAIQLAELVLETQADNQKAKDIVARALLEKDNLARYNQARALFEAEQYDKAFVKLSKVPEESVYAVRANNMSLRIRQAVVLPEIIRRPNDAVMRRVLIGAFARGSDDREVEFAMELCEEHVGDCQEKWFTRESPRRWITLGSFYIDAHEVSVAEYQACVDDGACPDVNWDDCGLQGEEKAPFNVPELPQVCVTWEEAGQYCKHVGTRLPSEAEWEKAAGGLRNDRFPWGADWESDEANFADPDGQYDGFKNLAPVTAFEANDYGLRNMSGNAYEWVQDWYNNKYYKDSEEMDPRGPSEGKDRVIRGGAFTRAPSDLRVAHRNRMYPETRDKSVGFRCATAATSIPSDVPAATAQASPEDGTADGSPDGDEDLDGTVPADDSPAPEDP